MCFYFPLRMATVHPLATSDVLRQPTLVDKMGWLTSLVYIQATKSLSQTKTFTFPLFKVLFLNFFSIAFLETKLIKFGPV